MNKYVMGLDLGQSQDYTALAVVERIPQYVFKEHMRRSLHGKRFRADERVELLPHLHCRHLERFPLGTLYPDIVTKVADMLRSPALAGAILVVDATGVGRAVVDMFRSARLRPVAVVITGGDAVSHDQYYWRVPKRDLVGAVQAPLQDKRLKFAEGLPLIPTLVQEMLNFKVKITDNAHDSYGSWREGVHDDLILSVMLASWAAQSANKRKQPTSREN
jgi:hypothetical protein